HGIALGVDLDEGVRRVEALGHALQEADGDLRLVLEHRGERLGLDDEEVARLDDGGAEGAPAAVEDRELAEEIALAELGHGLEAAAPFPLDAHATALDHVHRAGLVADVEDDRARFEGLHDAFEMGVGVLTLARRDRHLARPYATSCGGCSSKEERVDASEDGGRAGHGGVAEASAGRRGRWAEGARATPPHTRANARRWLEVGALGGGRPRPAAV